MMQVEKLFVSVNARDFAAQSAWWATLLGRRWDREPMPSCHEWDLAGCVAFQVLDAPDGGRTSVSLHIRNLDAEITRLRDAGVSIDNPVAVEGFENLRYASFRDPEGNSVGLLEGG